MDKFLRPTVIQVALYRAKDGSVMFAPIVDAQPVRGKRAPYTGKVVGLSFKCPYCGNKHMHGVGEGTRVPACRPGRDPKVVLGYYLRPAGAEGPLLGRGEDLPDK